jgi:type IV pilus assembly protein PilV
MSLHTTFIPHAGTARGATLLEVLITIVILAFGLLGLVGLEAKMQTSEVESYQRAQALILLNDMVDRMNAQLGSANALANPGDVPAVDAYASATVYGTGDTPATPCSTQAQGAARDHCEWSVALQGAAETQGARNLGAMIGARGCITQLQAPNTNTGVCTPGIYLVSVAWQGLNMTAAPPAGATCGLNSYGDEKYRRVVSARVMVGLPSCS